MVCVCSKDQHVVTYADGIRGGGTVLPPFVCVSVCFPHDISKPDAARNTKLDIDNYVPI